MRTAKKGNKLAIKESQVQRGINVLTRIDTNEEKFEEPAN